MMKQENKYLPIFLVVIFALAAILFSLGNWELNKQAILEIEQSNELRTELENTPVLAKAVSVYNITENKKVYGKNDEVVMPIASLAKIMVVAVALNSYKEDEVLNISPSAISQAGDYGLFAEEKWRVDNLSKFTLISSANDGAYALSENTTGNFLEAMNSKARRLGLEQTSFLNPTGLDINENDAGAFASASEVNIMAMYGFRAYPGIASATTMPQINLESESGLTHDFKNTDPILGKIPNLLFSKTGYTEIAGGNLTVIFKNKSGEEIAVTVLGSTFDGRFADMEKLVNVLYTR